MALAWNEGRGIGAVIRREPSVLALRTRTRRRGGGQNRPFTRPYLRIISSIHSPLAERRMRSSYFTPEAEFIRTERYYAGEQGPAVAENRYRELGHIPNDQLNAWDPDFQLSTKTTEAIVIFKAHRASDLLGDGSRSHSRTDTVDKDHAHRGKGGQSPLGKGPGREGGYFG